MLALLALGGDLRVASWGSHRCTAHSGRGARGSLGGARMFAPLRGGDGASGRALVPCNAALGDERVGTVIARNVDDGAILTQCLLRRCVPGYYSPHNVSGWEGGVWDGHPAPPCELCGALPMHRCAGYDADVLRVWQPPCSFTPPFTTPRGRVLPSSYLRSTLCALARPPAPLPHALRAFAGVQCADLPRHFHAASSATTGKTRG